MEKNGLIHREAMADDARLKRIILDEKALQYKDVVLADITNLEEELTAGIAEEDLDVFFRVSNLGDIGRWNILCEYVT